MIRNERLDVKGAMKYSTVNATQSVGSPGVEIELVAKKIDFSLDKALIEN
jgi:hypothetical protein